MSLFWSLILLTLAFSINPSESKNQNKLPSAVLVGTVYCDKCFHQDFSKAKHVIEGATIAVECKNTRSSPRFRQEVKTDNHGEFKAHLPFSVSKHAKKINGCSVKLISSNEPYCSVAATTTSTSLNLKSRKEGIHIFSSGFFTFKPLNQPQGIRARFQSCQSRLAHRHPHYQSTCLTYIMSQVRGRVENCPTLRIYKVCDQKPRIWNFRKLSDDNEKSLGINTKKETAIKSPKLSDEEINQPADSIPLIFPPNPLQPPVIPPNPLQPPPSVLPPVVPSPPPSIFPPVFPSPPPTIFPPVLPAPPSPPSFNLPPIPGFTPSAPPPPPPFHIPFPPFPFLPPGFPGVPPADGSSSP